MVNISGLRVQSTYEQVAAQVELDDFKVKLPNRVARFVLEFPSVFQLDSANKEEIMVHEKRSIQEAWQAKITKVAQESSVSRALLEEPTHETKCVRCEHGHSISPQASGELWSG